MPSPVIARSAAVLAALALGIACVPELTEAVPYESATPESAVTSTSTGAAEQRPDRARYDRVLPRDLSGERVLDTAADLVPRLAERNGLPVHRLGRLLEDPTVRVSPEGRVYVVEPGYEAREPRGRAEGSAYAQEEAATQSTGALGSVPRLGAAFSDADTFRLESRPGAARTIVIDADGATVANTWWNPKVPNGTWAGYDEDGDPKTFTSGERAFIRQVWRQVADAYAPFDVNVTTRDLPPDAWQRSSESDSTWGTRVVITSSATPHQALCSGACAGVAPVGTFGDVDTRDRFQPAWVFVRGDMVRQPTITAQTVSHEVGHTVGLGHDGKDGQAYTFGSNRWGPLMGGATQRAVSQWSKGEYAGATNTAEDDLAVITANNLPYAADDHGSTTAAATVLGATSAYDVEGVIGTRGDTDLFRLEVGCTLALDARARGIGYQGSLDAGLDLLNDSGTVIASNAPTTTHDTRYWDQATSSWKTVGMDAALTSTLSPGTYYLRVDGTGSGGATAVADMTGWSDYGSLGRYRVTATGCASTTPPTTAPPTTTPPTTAPPTSVPTSTTSPGTTPSTPPTTTPPTTTPPTTAPPTTTPPAVAPGAPTLGTASSGTKGRPVTVTVRWAAPSSTGGSAVTGYKITAHKLGRRNAVTRTFVSPRVPATATTVQLGLPAGRYKVAVQAVNAAGTSPFSATSKVVTAR